MHFKKAPDWLKDLFAEVVAPLPGERRVMFGYPAAFLNGHLVTSVFADRVVVRLSPADRERLMNIDGAEPFEPLPGRFMTEYVVTPAEFAEDTKSLRSWVDRAFGFVATLPPKETKAAAAKKTPAKKAPAAKEAPAATKAAKKPAPKRR